MSEEKKWRSEGAKEDEERKYGRKNSETKKY